GQRAKAALEGDLQDADQNLGQGGVAHKVEDSAGHESCQDGQEAGDQGAEGVGHALGHAVGHFDPPALGQHRGVDPAGEQGHDDGGGHAAAAGPGLGDDAADGDVAAGDSGGDQRQKVDQGDQPAGKGLDPFELGVLVADAGGRSHGDDV